MSDPQPDDARLPPADERLVCGIERIGRDLERVLAGVIVIAALLAGIFLTMIL